jgi:hypothetical protein
VEVIASIKGTVVHEAVVKEVVEKVVLIANFGGVEHICGLELHVLEVVLGRGEQTIVAQNFRSVSDDYDVELRGSVTYKADYQSSEQAIVARIRGQAGYLMWCWHPY